MAATAAAAAATAASREPRRYVGDGAGMTDEGGVGGPRGDGRGKEWTVDLCSKRLSLLHRKLRQVKDLLAKQARDPGALDEWQEAKVDRKRDLQVRGGEGGCGGCVRFCSCCWFLVFGFGFGLVLFLVLVVV